jgi:hypothetical protein
VAHWLQSHAFPAVRPSSRLPQPQVVDGFVVSWWDAIAEHPNRGTPGWAELGAVLRALHQLPSPPPGLVAPFDPFARIDRRLAGLPKSLRRRDARFLRRLAAKRRREVANLRFELGSGLILGGPGPSDLVRDVDGGVWLIDLSEVAWGAREWDAVALAAGHRYFNHNDVLEYRATVAAYGWDPLLWQGHRTIESVDELDTTVRCLTERDDPNEIAALLDDLRTSEH